MNDTTCVIYTTENRQLIFLSTSTFSDYAMDDAKFTKTGELHVTFATLHSGRPSTNPVLLRREHLVTTVCFP